MTYQYVEQVTTKEPNALSDGPVFAAYQKRPMSPAMRRAILGEPTPVFVFRKAEKKGAE